MKTVSKCTALLLAALACGATQAAEPIEVGVVGRLAPVISCEPTLSQGALDYGVLKASDLNRDGQTALPEKVITVRIACQSRVNGLIVSFPDNKADDAVRVPGVVQHPLCGQDCGEAAFGLGRDGQDRKIGALFLADKGADIDGKPAIWDRILGPKDGPSAKARLGLFGPYHRPSTTDRTYSYLPKVEGCRPTPGGSQCTNGKQFVIPIGVNPVIDSKGREVSGDMRLRGAFSIEIRIL